MAALLAAGSLGATWLGSVVEAAAADTSFSIQYKAPPSCPDRGAFIAEIQHRSRVAKPVGQGEQPEVALAVEISEKSAGRFRGRLHITQGTDARERAIEGRSCAQVSRALALVAALAVDPLAETHEVEPLPVPPDPNPPPIHGTQPALPVGPAPRLDPPWEPPRPGALPPVWDMDLVALPLPTWVVPVPPPPWITRWGLRGLMTLDAGLTPSPLLGGGVGLEVARARDLEWSVRATLSASATPAVDRQRGKLTSYRLVRGSLGVCAPGADVTAWLFLSPCLDLEGGSLAAATFRTASQDEIGEGPYFAAKIQGRAELLAGDSVRIGLELGPLFPLVTPHFVDETGAAFFDPSPAAFTSALTLGARF